MGGVTASPEENKADMCLQYRKLQKVILALEAEYQVSKRPRWLRWLPPSRYEREIYAILQKTQNRCRDHINMMRAYGAFDDLV